MLRDIFVVFAGVILAMYVQGLIQVLLGKVIKKAIDEALDESKKNQSYTNYSNYSNGARVTSTSDDHSFLWKRIEELASNYMSFKEDTLKDIQEIKDDIEKTEDDIEELNSWCKSNETKIGLIEKELQKTNPDFLLPMESQEEE